jgi:endonuclease-3 related protein
MPSLADQLMQVHDRLLAAFGPQHWWPAASPFEVMVGAVLTQNTNWQNVERAIANLEKAGVLDPDSLHRMDHQALAELIRPAGYFNIKARRLKNFVAVLHDEFEGRLENMADWDTESLREVLVSTKGIGPETADSMLLYALERPVFVIDAYTYRITVRLGLAFEDADYYQLQEMFVDNLPADVKLYNEFHALLVGLGKNYCRPKPKCEPCPLLDQPCPDGQNRLADRSD